MNRSRIILTVVGARPQFVKAAMLSRVLARHGQIQEILVHTGQHYDYKMSAIFFNELHLPVPRYNLEVGSHDHAEQTALMLQRLNAVYEQEQVEATLVYGDTNSTLAGALASAKRHLPVIHVEAGMRSGDLYQPEEINRILTDHLSKLLFCSSPRSAEMLQREGITNGVHITGDIMIDTALAFQEKLSLEILRKLGATPRQYVLVTIHRPETTDIKEHLQVVVHSLSESTRPVIFPVHPRTRRYLEQYGLLAALTKNAMIQLIEPLSYTEMLALVKHAQIVLTDSGGLQKEAYFFSVPCVTVRHTTEWQELVEVRWNIVSGYDRARISELLRTFTPPPHHPPLFGDGQAAERMHDLLVSFLERKE